MTWDAYSVVSRVAVSPSFQCSPKHSFDYHPYLTVPSLVFAVGDAVLIVLPEPHFLTVSPWAPHSQALSAQIQGTRTSFHVSLGKA